MLNLVRYVQCRAMRTRHKKALVIVFIIFLIYFFLSEKSQSNIVDLQRKELVRENSDAIVSLKAQNGYLKHKLIKFGGVEGEKVSIDDPYLPVIYVITPTYARPVQKAELTRLCYTFLMVPNLHWILVEDAKAKTDLVTNFISNCGVSFTHLNHPTPPDWKLKDKEQNWRKPRGVLQRNEGLLWIRDNVKPRDGVVYFADDDNTYSLDLFEEMRYTKKVSVWAVGLVGGLMVERPDVDSNGMVKGWKVVWAPNRPFAVDMAGFAVNLRHLLNTPKAKFAYEVKRGHQESEFLKHLTSVAELEVKGHLGQKVMVWHTRTERVKLDMEKKLHERGLPPSDVAIEV